MKIAQIAPLMESVPPRLYGGTERVVSYITEELVALGHDVSLFASGDSVTSAELVACAPEALRLDARVKDPIPHYMVMLEALRRRAHEFDVLHFHIDHVHFPVFSEMASHTLTTLHGRLDLPDLPPLFRTFCAMPLTSVSLSQRLPLPYGNFVANIYHGIPERLHTPRIAPREESYLAFIGRISREKRPDLAIRIARSANMKLKLAAKVDAVDRDYFEREVAPLLGPDTEFIGEIGEHQKTGFLGDAEALLFPIDWPEPFGLVMIEAMACSTPVLAFDAGSVREVVDDGVTGRIVSSMDEAVKALPEVLALNRSQVRATFENRFSARTMAQGYVDLYERMMRTNAAGARNLTLPRTPVFSRRAQEPTQEPSYAREAGLL
jgi:glycosyltransferase involved in cell wall biosynthesis